MDRFKLRRLFVALGEARKGKFELKCKLENNDYTFVIDRDTGITVTIHNNVTDVSVTTTYPDAESVEMVKGNYKIEYIKEIILTPSKRIYSETTNYCLELIQVYLPVFRVLGEQVVFLMKYKGGVKQMYFINGRVFYTDSSDTCLTLHQTDLRKVFNSFPNAEILYFERLPDRYSYKNIFNECHSSAIAQGKTWEVVKNGVVSGGVRDAEIDKRQYNRYV